MTAAPGAARSVEVLLADDQAVVRSGLRTILESDPRIRVVAEAEDGERAVALARAHRPDVVLMDVRMPRMDGIAATRALSRDSRPVDVLVLTTFDLDEYVIGALRAGAVGFLLKDASPERIIEAVLLVARGDGLIAPEVTRRLVRQVVTGGPPPTPDPRLEGLTAREHEVLAAVARGLTNAEIARQLHLEEATIKTHVGRILGKLGLTSRVQAVVHAYETGYVVPGRDDRPAGR